jgi:aspartyl-tRNA(Asn)/glutamyl-tRNA(Gln) amidotransferase subunit A
MRSRREFLFSVCAAASASVARAADNSVPLTLEDAAGLLRRRKISPVDLTKACIARIERLNPSLNAFITVTAERALSKAKALESELRTRGPRSPLHGIPVALKDLIDTAGVRTTAGSALWADRVPDADAVVARRLDTAGAILVGKCNMDEFAYNFTSETSYFGASRNPWDVRRTPGGSSGGAAIAIATGMCLAALGSDTGGSIRLPAALCGITGLKPTYGRVSTEGAAPLAWSLDHIGPMCRSARDAEWVLDVLAPASRASSGGSLRGLRLGVPRKPYYDQLDSEVQSAVEDALRVLVRLTSGVRDVNVPALPVFEQWPDLPRTYSVIISAEAHAFHREMLARSPEKYHPGTRRSLESGASISAAEYIDAHREMGSLRDGAGRLFSEAHLLITPSSPAPAFELGKPAGLVFLRNCAPWTLYGLPSISLPCGFSRNGLPVGLQITAPAGRDSLLLEVAKAYQKETDWHLRRPAGIQASL